ncbi:MAG: hypothetical protein OEM32_04575 [Acidimicrobiia bacterium]|nr:hypothetical protein [Acidimicrobiia bacterium]
MSRQNALDRERLLTAYHDLCPPLVDAWGLYDFDRVPWRKIFLQSYHASIVRKRFWNDEAARAMVAESGLSKGELVRNYVLEATRAFSTENGIDGEWTVSISENELLHLANTCPDWNTNEPLFGVTVHVSTT